MSKFLHNDIDNDDTKAVAIPQAFSKKDHANKTAIMGTSPFIQQNYHPGKEAF